MREVRLIVIYFVGVVVLAAVLAPFLFAFGQWAGPLVNIRALSSSGFERYFNRAILFAAVVLLFPLLRALKIRDPKSLGLTWGSRPLRMLLIGVGSAAGLLAIEYVLIRMTGWFPPGAGLLRALPRILATAIVVSLIEEPLFRGALQNIAMRGMGRAGFWLVATLFAVIHYIKPPAYAVTGPEVGLFSGFALLPHVFWMFSDYPAQTVASLFSLFIAAVILGRAAERTGGLALPIGLHIGWILGLEGMKAMLTRMEMEPFQIINAWPWVGNDLLGGLVPAVLLLIQGALLEWWYRRRFPR